MKVAVIYNPVKISKAELEAAIKAAAKKVSSAALQSGQPRSRPTLLWYETSVEDVGTGQAKAAVEAGVSVVMAAGGDGTVRAVAEGLRSTGIPLALLPSGTGNILAINLDLAKLSLAEAVEVAMTGTERKIDVAEIGLLAPDGSTQKTSYMVMGGLGLDAVMIEKTDENAKKTFGWIAYLNGMIRATLSSRRIKIRLKIDGKKQPSREVHTILIGNCGVFTGGAILLPVAALDDGLLDIASVGPRTIFGWQRLWRRVFFDNPIIRRQHNSVRGIRWKAESSSYEFFQGREIFVAPEEPMLCEIDGDVIGEVVGMKVRIDPLALTVRVPKQADK